MPIEYAKSFRRSYGYRTTASGRKVARDEPGESDNNPDVRRHNQYVAQQLKQRKNKEAARKRMVDRGIVPKKQGKPMYEVKENSPTPNLQALEGNTYYFKCPNDNRYYKTIYIKRNPFSPNHLQPMISNEIWRTAFIYATHFSFICSFIIAYEFISILIRWKIQQLIQGNFRVLISTH